MWKLCTLALVLAVYNIYGVSSQSSYAPVEGAKPPVTDVCLGCICQAVSGCNTTTTCTGDSCGLFRITWAYWSDAGKLTNGEPSDAPQAYTNCVTEPYCAARTVQGYMARFGQDCNNDGQINCYDHMAIHKKGGYGCGGELPYEYQNVFNRCIEAVRQQQG